MQLYNDDCFNIFPKIKEKVDMVLCDLPYAQTCLKWDIPIDLKQMWIELKKICKKDCVYVFFCTTKFGYKLIQSNEKWFRYDLVWEKSRKVGFLNANRMPLRKHEMMYVFKEKGGTYNPQKTEGKAYNKTNTGNNNQDSIIYGKVDRSGCYTGEEHRSINKGDRHPTSIIHIPEVPENQKEREHEMVYIFKEKQGTYNPQKEEGKRYIDKRNYADKAGYYRKEGKLYTHKPQDNKGLNHPTSILYIPEAPEDQEERKHEMVYVFKDKQGTYNPQKEEGKPYKTKGNKSANPEEYLYDDRVKEFYPVENTGTRHPTTIVKFNNPSKSVHRTQKPVDLCEWLIKSYSNEGELVLDFTMGSGSTGLACKNTNRKFIGIEKDEKIFKIAQKRVL